MKKNEAGKRNKGVAILECPGKASLRRRKEVRIYVMGIQG